MTDSITTRGVHGQWFAPAIAVWCALLLGVGFYLMPPGVHGALARGSGLAQASPLFATPLSQTGLLILCAGFAVVGLIIGWAVARRIMAATAPRAFAPGFAAGTDTAWDEPAMEESLPLRRRRIFSAREDLDEVDVDPHRQDEGMREPDPVPEQPAPSPPEPEPLHETPQLEPAYADWVEEDNGPSEPDDALQPHDDQPIDLDVQEAEYTEIVEEPDGGEPSGFSAAPSGPSNARTMPQDEPLGDMSLHGLLARLETALETHRNLVARAEASAQAPAPQPVPMTPASMPSAGAADGELGAVADDDPVIAFLRREASRRQAPVPPAGDDDDTDPPTWRSGEDTSGHGGLQDR